MCQQKGFSLIEVLLSLMLTTTIALLLLQLQNHTSLFVNQVVQNSQASSILDQADEELLLGTRQRFKPVDPYTLHIEQNIEHTKVSVSWLSQSYMLSRIYSAPRFVSE
jgi:prepilin-type N-terminal cleavage/methylation domain-containing protein